MNTKVLILLDAIKILEMFPAEDIDFAVDCANTAYSGNCTDTAVQVASKRISRQRNHPFPPDYVLTFSDYARLFGAKTMHELGVSSLSIRFGI